MWRLFGIGATSAWPTQRENVVAVDCFDTGVSSANTARSTLVAISCGALWSPWLVFCHSADERKNFALVNTVMRGLP